MTHRGTHRKFRKASVYYGSTLLYIPQHNLYLFIGYNKLTVFIGTEQSPPLFSANIHIIFLKYFLQLKVSSAYLFLLLGLHVNSLGKNSFQGYTQILSASSLANLHFRLTGQLSAPSTYNDILMMQGHISHKGGTP